MLHLEVRTAQLLDSARRLMACLLASLDVQLPSVFSKCKERGKGGDGQRRREEERPRGKAKTGKTLIFPFLLVAFLILDICLMMKTEIIPFTKTETKYMFKRQEQTRSDGIGFLRTRLWGEEVYIFISTECGNLCYIEERGQRERLERENKSKDKDRECPKKNREETTQMVNIVRREREIACEKVNLKLKRE